MLVFVHGYNNTFSQGLYRLAQVATDFETKETLAYYSWPSTAKPLAYVADRDRTVLSRSHFEAFMDQVAATNPDEITVVAHSMGSHLVMETMRGVALSDRRKLDRLFDQVVLISPDIDVEVFHSQLSDIGKLPAPLWIMGSEHDQALALSARLTGETRRLGNEGSTVDFSEFDVVYVDVTALDDGERGNHSTVLTSEKSIDLFGDLYGLYESFSDDPSARIGVIPGAALRLNNSVKVTVGRGGF
ncbi:MAG: alpha/beta hydrolase [Paracoccaceae bacterium]